MKRTLPLTLLCLFVVACGGDGGSDSEAGNEVPLNPPTRGFCSGGVKDGPCCWDDADCDEGQECVSKQGACFDLEPCDSIFECGHLFPAPIVCMRGGTCMGGKDHGSPCILARGYCSMPMGPRLPCNNNLDCGGAFPCVVDPDETTDLWGCSGGTCEPCVKN